MPNQVWAFDFQFDSTVDGRRLKIASMIDEYTRESLLNIVDYSITAERLVTEIRRVIGRRQAVPAVLRCDNGPELVSNAVAEYCEDNIGIYYIPPGEPWHNGFIESFNNRVRDECLQLNRWRNILEARIVIGDWKNHYNRHHRHSNLDYLTPTEYAHQHQTTKRL
jgi:transposase InsO family protein